MTICVTGDVHHMSLGTRDQEYLDRTELEAAIEYAQIAEEYDVPITLFVTGLAASEEPERVSKLARMDHVEIGGHNYWAFDRPIHSLWRALEKASLGQIGSWNGPRRFQAYEIRKTRAVLEQTGAEITSWRDHAYRHDNHTTQLLANHGITHFSDAVGPDQCVREESGLTIVPVNTPPDHEHVYHAFRTPEYVSTSEFNGPFGEQSVPVTDWVKWVTGTIEEHHEDERISTVLAHPSCLDIADGLQSFGRICEKVSEMDPRTVSEIEPS